MTTDIEAIIDNMSDGEAEQLGRWWAIRQYAIETGLFAERELLRLNALDITDRRFLNRQEWRRLTQQR